MNSFITSVPPATESGLAELLCIRASWLSYYAFALCVQRVLGAQGYEEIRMLGRTKDGGPSPFGGIDMDALAPLPFGRAASLIQLKRHARSVPRRFVDELRGTMLRYDVPHGVVVSVSKFSLRAREAAIRYPGRPVRLIDGGELGRLMLAARIGVTEGSDVEGRPVLAFSEPWFESLESHVEKLRKMAPNYPLAPHR